MRPRRSIETRNESRSTHKNATRLVAFGMKSALVFGLCLVFSSTSSASISPLTKSAIHDSSRSEIEAVDGGSSEETNNNYDYDSVPWQPNPSNHHNIDEAARYEDMPPSVFSPTGRLHPVEAAVRASKAQTPMSNLLVAMVCKDGLLVVSTVPISPHVDTAYNTSIDSNATITNSDKEDSSDENDANNAFSKTISSDSDENLPSLFLFDETCASTSTGPIFDIHPCIVGATAGNAVDNRIMRTKLLALGLHAMDQQGMQDVSTARVAKDLANQLQVLTQDLAAAQKQKLGRMLASSAVLLGSRQIWRVDPTGQFWDCHATVLGEDADRAEEEFYRRILKECKDKQSVRELLDSLSQKEALELVQDFLETRVAKQEPPKLPPSKQEATKSVDNDGKGKKNDDSLEPGLSSQVYWQAMILDYSSLTKRETPRRKLKRGVFGIRRDKV